MATNNNVFASPDQSSSDDVLVSPTTAFRDVTMEEQGAAPNGEGEGAHDEDPLDSDDWLELDVHHAAAAQIVTYGAHLIDARRPFDAIEILRESVDLLSRPSVFIRASDDAALEKEYHATVDDAVSKAERFFVDGVSSSESDHQSNMLAEAMLVGERDTTNPLLVYSHPVYLQEPQSGSVVLDEVSTVALYNLALAHHMAGTSRSVVLASSDPSRIRALLDKALALYGMAESLLVRLRDAYPRLLQDEATSSQLLLGPGDLTRLSMALANNVGAILMGDGRNHVRGRERFEGLRRFLIATHADDDEEFDAARGVFELNVLGASQMNGTPAA